MALSLCIQCHAGIPPVFDFTDDIAEDCGKCLSVKKLMCKYKTGSMSNKVSDM